MSFLNQNRIVLTRSPIEIWSYGPLRSQDAWVCYLVYQAMELSNMASALTTWGTFSLKYHVVTDKEVNKFNVLKSFVRFYTLLFLSIFFVVIIVKDQTLSWQNQENLRLINTFFNQGDYSTTAYIKFSQLPNVFNLLVFIALLLMVPTMSLYNRKKILRQINHRAQNMSEARQTLHRKFLTGLTIQVLLPYVFYVPFYIIYYYSFLTSKEFLFVEFTMTFFPVVLSVVNPLITMYFVMPYRQKLLLWAKRERKEIRTAAAFAS